MTIRIAHLIRLGIPTSVLVQSMQGEDRVEPRPSSLSRLVTAVACGSLGSYGIRLISGLIITRYVLPDDLGLFNGLGLILTYSPLLLAGVAAGLGRELPIRLGQADPTGARQLSDCAFWWGSRIGFLGGTVLLCASAAFLCSGNMKAAAGFSTLALCVPCACLIPCFQACLKTRSQFVRVARAQVMAALVGLFTVLLVRYWGFYGLCVRSLLVMVAEAVLLYRAQPHGWRPRWSGGLFKALTGTGLPIFAMSMLLLAWRSMDSVILLYLAGPTSLGLYQAAVLVTQGGTALTNALGQVLYPRMAESFGRTGHAGEALRMIWRPMFVAGALSLPAFALLYIALPKAIAWVMPQYAAGTEAAQWACVSAYLGCFLSNLPIFNVLKRQSLLAISLGISACTFAAVLPKAGETGVSLLAGFARATAASTLVLVVVSHVLSVWAVENIRPGSTHSRKPEGRDRMSSLAGTCAG